METLFTELSKLGPVFVALGAWISQLLWSQKKDRDDRKEQSERIVTVLDRQADAMEKFADSNHEVLRQLYKLDGKLGE